MSNNLTSSQKEKLITGFVKGFENTLVLGKSVDTSTTKDGFDARTGETIYVERDHQSKAVRTSGGDLTSATADEIVSGRISVTKQDYITVFKDWTDVEQALKIGELEKVFEGIANEMATTLETSLGEFMINNAGLTYGTPGQPINNWNEVSGAAALMKSVGVPMGNACYVMNPFAQSNLAGVQNALNASNDLVKTAWEMATISQNVGGLRAITSNSLKNYQSGASTARSGTLSATPDATYVTHKDSMTQSLALTGLTNSVTNALRAGDVLEFTGTGANARSNVNINTRETIMGPDGSPVKWRTTIKTGGNTNGSGAVTVTASAPGIYETAAGKGAYNNISAALASGDAFTILGAKDANYQPNLFYGKGAFMVTTIQIPQLEGHIGTYKSKSGYVLRFTRGSSFLGNTHQLRVDMVPAFGVVHPLMSGKGFGLA